MEDSLIAAELATFGVSSAEETLPMPPPKEGLTVGTGGTIGAKRSSEASSIIAPIGRAKRPKNVKFSPAKVGGKALARRSMTTSSGPKNGLTDGEVSLPNNDFCDACGGKGHFLCCDGGCLRSFHFNCLEPPMELDDLTDESWFCKACRAVESPPPKYDLRFFKELIYRVDTENPKAFGLTADIKSLFKNVTTGATGDFIDIQEHRPPSKITGRAVGQEDRDGYRLKDKSGHTVLCYKCNTAASLPKLKRIISCDFCEQHWHLDCLDPPMTGMPPPTRKWMCPVHSDHVLPKSRQLKQTQTVVVQQPGQHNNGDVIIIPRREAPRPMDEFEEITVNRIRYQVPEETLIIDFWGRLQDPTHLEQAKRARKRVTEAGSPIEIDSPDSADELSDDDPPHLVKTTKMMLPQNTVALDNLASLAELFFTQLNTATNSYSAQDKGKGKASNEPLSPTSTRSPNLSTSMRRTSGSGQIRGGATEFSVQNKEDLKALSRVRQLLSQSGSDALDPPTRSAYLDFLDGEAIIPKLASMSDEESSKSPWDLPWDSNSSALPATTPAARPTHIVSPWGSVSQLGEKPISKFTPRPSYTGSSTIPGLIATTSNSTPSSNRTRNNNSTSPKMSGLNTSTSNPNRPTLPLPARTSISSASTSSSSNSSTVPSVLLPSSSSTTSASTKSQNHSRAPISMTPTFPPQSIPGLNRMVHPASTSTTLNNTVKLGISTAPPAPTPAMENAFLVEQAKKEMAKRGML